MSHTTPPDDQPAEREPADTPVTCALCRTPRPAGALTWTCSVENGARRHFCDRCARTHLRSIEGRLDSAWW